MPLDFLPLHVLSVLQFHTPGKHLLPNLKTLKLSSMPAARDSISFIPLFLSPKLTVIELRFSKLNAYRVMAASMIATLPITCPDLQKIRLEGLPRDPVIICAVSQFVTANRGTLRSFHVDSPLTQEAAEILYKSPHLCELHTVVDGPTSLPAMELPNLTRMDIKFYHHYDWLQGFLGASLGKLVSLTFRCESRLTGLLEAFKQATVATSIPTTLLTFHLCTTRPWRPNYRSLLPFTHLTKLDIEFPCVSNCSSTIDDDSITELAQALHELEFLYLGGRPCEASAGVTAKGLSALAYYCPHLRHLRIHFQIATLDPPDTPLLASSGKSREDCALTFLDVGYIRVPDASMLIVALTLLRIFPNLESINYSDSGWERVADAIYGSKQVASCSSKGLIICGTSTRF